MRCEFKNRQKKKGKLKNFLRKYGDMPDAEANRLVEEEVDNFASRCDKENNVISAATYKDTDWYLCSIKGLATKPGHRGKGLGTKVVGDVMEKTKKNPNCHVLTSDITYDNIPSKRIFQKRGFEEVNKFCWGVGEKPAGIFQMVRFPPKDNKCKAKWKEK